MNSETMDFWSKIISNVLPVITLILGILITQHFNSKNEENRRKWEKQKSHRDYELELIKNLKNKIDIFIEKNTPVMYTLLADVMGLRLVKTQQELDNYYLKAMTSEGKDTDEEMLWITYSSAVRAFGSNRLIEIHSGINNLFEELTENWRHFYIDKPQIDIVLREIDKIADRSFDIRKEYDNLVVEFYQELDKAMKEADPFKDEK